jgi:hypothetical protein
MGETEKRLREEVRRLLKQAEATDEEEDKRYGRERQGDELPEELQRRETRIARIREAKKALKERAREKAESEGKDRKEAQPEPKAQYNFTDPESRIMKGPELVGHEIPENIRKLIVQVHLSHWLESNVYEQRRTGSLLSH